MVIKLPFVSYILAAFSHDLSHVHKVPPSSHVENRLKLYEVSRRADFR